MKRFVPLSIPNFNGNEKKYVDDALEQGWVSTGGAYITRLEQQLAEFLKVDKAAACQSGTSGLHLALVECGVQPGDMVIVPTLTFIAAVNPVRYQFAEPVFMDCDESLCLDPEKLAEFCEKECKLEAQQLVHKKSGRVVKAVIVVHVFGNVADMEAIMSIAGKYHLKVVEDAAQGVMASYKGRALGTIGDFGCYSFHETKNFSMGEGGALVINDPETVTKAEILREKGTNRASFLRGQVDKYTWVSYGSSYLPSDLNAAYLWAQLEQADTINTDRTHSWDYYAQELAPLAEAGLLELPTVPEGCVHNGHLFYVKLRDLEQRTAFIAYLKAHGVASSFHYVPLHSAPAGIQYGRFAGVDEYTTKESNRLTRLPLYYGLTEADRAAVVQVVKDFFAQK